MKTLDTPLSAHLFNIQAQTLEPKAKTIAVVAYPGVEIIDVAGPLEVFSFANIKLQNEGITKEPAYTFKVLAEKPGPIITLSGVEIIANAAYRDYEDNIDTLVIPGGLYDSAINNPSLLAWIQSMSLRVRRLASVCTGAFLLAESGLLDGRRATTHWNYCSQLARDYPSVTVEPDKIFIRDNFIFTSGGITSGIDLTLAMVEDDFGPELALYVARFLVVFLKRPGGQSQFSAYMTSEPANHPDLRNLQAWIMTHLMEDLQVEALAERVAMSPRNFARLFLTETGMTPAKFVEMARIDAARHYLGSTELSIESVADKAGFKDPERMRRAFIRQLGVNPQNYRDRFGHRIAAEFQTALKT